MKEKRYIVDEFIEVKFIDKDITILKTSKGRFLLKGKNISLGVKEILQLFETPNNITDILRIKGDEYSEETLRNLIEYFIDKAVVIDSEYLKEILNYDKSLYDKIKYYEIYGKSFREINGILESKKIGIIGNRQFVDCMLNEFIRAELFTNFNIYYTDNSDCSDNEVNKDKISIMYYTDCFDDIIRKIVNNSDFVVVSSDYNNHFLFSEVNSMCIEHNREWLRILIDEDCAEIGPLFIPSQTCCYDCMNYRAESNMTESEYLFNSLYKNKFEENKPRGLYYSYFLNNFISSITNMEILKYLLMNHSSIINGVLRVDAINYKVEREHIFRVSKCIGCSNKEV